jgi:hypothetical protein
MATRLVILPYLQRWDGAALHVRLLLIPRGNPLDPLIAGAPNFSAANFVFDIHLLTSPDALPTPGGAPFATVSSPVVATALPVFNALAAIYAIDPAPPTAKKPPATQVKKHLPLSYQQAVGFAPGRTPLVFTDDTYSCALQSPPSRPFKRLPLPNPQIGWGKVIAILLRNPVLAAAAGLIRTLDIAITPVTLLKQGGFMHVTLAVTSDGAGLLGVPDGLKLYATRIPALGTARDIFTPVLFPVVSPAPLLDYGEMFAEVDDYDDGWAKAVHAAQPQQLDPLNETPDGSRPAKEVGIRLGWDDEQVTIWMNRQIDAAQAGFDSPIGVQGYRIDTRHPGGASWHSLVHAAGPLAVGGVALGNFDGELGVETHPVQLQALKQGDLWLATYFANWIGPPLVTLDADLTRLSGGPDKTGEARVKGVPPGIALTYGQTYEFRVRLMDHTGGGPLASGGPAVPGPAPIATIPFRRWIRPLAPIATNPPPPDPDPLHPPPSITLKRPLLHHPAVTCTGFYPDPIASLLADLPAAKADGREPGLPDPDVDRVQIIVEVQALAQDPAATDGDYMPLHRTTRAFLADPAQPLTLDFDWVDIKDAATLSQPATGPLKLPTARTLRLRIAALGRDDTTLGYFGAQDVRTGPSIQVALRKNSGDETALFAPDLPTHRFSALFLQPDAVIDPVVLFAQRAAGALNERPADIASRLASTLGLRNDGLTLRAQAGRRVVFGCSASLRHVIGPDGASLGFAAQTDLALHWLVVLRLTLDRDWSWDGLGPDGLVVQRDGQVVGRFAPSRNVNTDALTPPDRTGTDLIFVDAIEPKPAPGTPPQELTPIYTVTASLQGAPTADPPLSLAIRLPVTTPPVQLPRIVSAGVALSPYQRSADYAATENRKRALWIELDSPPADKRDRYFARVLRNAPDPLLSRAGDSVPETAEPPLAIDPEWVRRIVQNEADDRAGIDAMQPMIPSDSPLHWALPLPAGLDETSPELLGFFTYELRVGHFDMWSTAQGRYGPPLRVAGVQHPPPPMPCTVLRNTQGIMVSVPFALPVLDGRPMQPLPPRSQIWVLLYAQAEQIDGEDRRNVLLGRSPALWERRTFQQAMASNAYGEASFSTAQVEFGLRALSFARTAPLSVLAVELLPQEVPPPDPLGADLGGQRILRISALTPVPAIC